MGKRIGKILIFVFCFLWPLGNLQAALLPNDQYYRNQWYLDKIHAYDAWDKITSSPNITIAVIDSGIQINHPDLKDNIWTNTGEIPNNGIDDDHNGFIDDANGWDFVDNVPDPSPKFSADYTDSGISHGTMVSGIIGAVGNNNIGVTGVTWKVKIMPLRALNDKGEGKISDVIRAVDYATKNGADIINLSFVGFSYSEGLREAIERAHQAGVIVVAAAGNDHDSGSNGYNVDETPIYPACYAGNNGENIVIGVAATDALDQKATFSSYGSSCVDITAPGISFFNTVTYNPNFADGSFNKYYDGYWSGTSMAAPIISGALALIKEANPNLKPDEIVNVLLKSADSIDSFNPSYAGKLGTGRVNLAAAVNWAIEKLDNYSGKLLIAPYASGPYQNFKSSEAHPNTIELAAANGATSSEFIIDKTKVKNSVNFTSGDLNGDGQFEVVVANGPGGEPVVKIFDHQGNFKKQFLAYDKNFKGGVSVAVGDINGDGQAEIITAPNSVGYPQIKIFDGSGKLKNSFLAYDRKFVGGVNVASGDVNGDGMDEIVTAPGVGGGPHVRIFDKLGNLQGQFMAYDKNFHGGVKVAVANIDGRVDHNKAEIITAPQQDYEPLVKIFDNWGKVKNQFLAYERKFKNGVNIAAGDVDNDGSAEIITGAGPGGAPHVRVFKAAGDLLESFYAYPASFAAGVNVGFILLNN